MSNEKERETEREVRKRERWKGEGGEKAGLIALCVKHSHERERGEEAGLTLNGSC